MSRPSNRTERRDQIAAAFIRVMSQRGYEGASIAEIARAAELTAGLVHHHFKNKQEILLLALAQLVDRHENKLRQSLAQVADPSAQLEVFLDAHLGVGATEDPQALACWILLSGEALRQPDVRVEFAKAIARIVALLSSIIRRGIDEGSFRCAHADAAAAALVATIQGYFVLAATARESIPRGSAMTAARQMAAGLLDPSRALVGG